MGVTVKVGANYSIDMSNYDYGIGDVGDADITGFTSTKITGYVGNYKVVISGAGFTTDRYGYLSGGEVRGIQETYGGNNVFSITGLHLSVKSIAKVIDTYSTADDIALVKASLGGNDSISGGNYADKLFGYAGNDALFGNKGDDRLYGHSGNDKLKGGLAPTICLAGLAPIRFSMHRSRIQRSAPLVAIPFSILQRRTKSTFQQSTPIAKR